MSINKLLIAGIVSVGLLESCAGDETAVTQSTGEPATIKLTLSTGSATTKTGGASGTSLPIGDGTLTGSLADEAHINRICVGLFDGASGTGKTVSIQEIENPSTSATNSVTTTTSATQIMVVANAPKGYFSGVTTLSEFQTKQAAILGYTTSADGNTAYTTASGANSQVTTAMPMASAVQSVTLSSTASTVVTTPLGRLVSRVAITHIETNFSSTGAYAGAVFTPTEVFMLNANTTYNWNGSMPSSTSIQNGESTGRSGAGSTYKTDSLSSYSYLSSGYVGTLTPTGTAPQQTYFDNATKPYFFYVFPNATASSTRLVIKGWWNFNGKTQVMYYPIIINHAQSGTDFGGSATLPNGTTDSQIAANTRYALSATILSIGVLNPAQTIDPANISLTVTVNAWATPAAQNVVFN